MAKSHTQQFNIEAGRAVKAIKTLAGGIKDYNKEVKESTKAQKGLSDSSSKVKGEFKDLAKNYKAASGEILRVKNEFVALRGELRAQRADIVRSSAQLFALKENAKQAASGLRFVSIAANNVKNDLKSASTSIRAFGRAIEKDAAGVRSIIVSLREFGKEIRGITRHMKTKNLALDEQVRATRADQGATNDLTQALSLMARVIEATLVHRALNALINGITDSITQARELSKRIAEIQTVSLEMTGGVLESAKGTREWRNELLSLSRNFGIPVLEQTEALYQALSNQVIEAADSTAFMSEEMKLAITAVSTLDEAVSVTSTVINAFQKDVSETARINAVLFKAVELGRFRLDELGSQFGRVSVLSHQLSISFEEQAAAIALLTRLGLQADVAQTLLTNVQLKLIKPTESMVELFNEWGVNSGRAAIATFGFQGVLQKMADAANRGGDSMQELGEIFQDLRAITGAAGLVGNLGLLGETIREVSNATESYNKAFAVSIEALGRKADIELEKMRQAFLVKFGEPVLRLFVELSEKVGGADVIFDLFVKTVVASSAAFVTYRATLVATAITTGQVAIATIALRTAISGLGVAIALVALDAALMESNIESSLNVLNANLIETSRKELEKTGDVLAETTAKALNFNEETFRSYFKMVAGVRATNLALSDDFTKKFKKIKEAIKDGLDISAERLTDRLRDLRRAADDARKAFEDAKERAFKDRFAEFDKRFAFSLEGKSDEDAISAIVNKKRELEALALDALAKGDIARSEELFKRVDDFAEEAEKRLRDLKEKITKDAVEIRDKVDLGTGAVSRTRVDGVSRIRVGVRGRRGRPATPVAAVEVKSEIVDREKIAKVEKIIVDLEAERRAHVEKRIAAEDAFAKRKEEEAKKLDAEVKSRERNLELFKNLITQVDTFDTSQKDAAAKFGGLLDKTSAAGKAAGLTPGEQLNFLRQAFAQRVLLEREAATQAAKERLDIVQKSLEDEKKLVDKSIRDKQAAQSKLATNIEAFATQNLVAAERLRKEFERPGITKSGQLVTKQRGIIDVVTGGTTGLDPTTRPVKNAIDDFERLNQKLLDTRRAGGDVAGVMKEIALAQERLQDALDELNLNENVKRVGIFSDPKASRNAKGEILFPEVPGKPQEALSDEVQKSKDALKKLLETQNQVNIATVNEQGAIQQVNALLAEKQARLEAIKRAHEQITIMQQQEAAALEAAKGPTPLPGFAHGGLVGTDRHVAAVSDGEFVMNRLASRMYAPLFRSMNRQAPSLRSQGSTTNNYGDINITTAAGTTDAQVLEIGQKLKRFQRRGVL